MPRFADVLAAHSALAKRYKESCEKLDEVRSLLAGSQPFQIADVGAFGAGSLSRGEAGTKSDLDVFLTTTPGSGPSSRLLEYKLIAEIIRINEMASFPDFSNDGEYLRIYDFDALIGEIGSPSDDGENYFTARMLLLLESSPLTDESIFNAKLTCLLTKYFRDGTGKADFKPLYLLNDILRYWRTLCLNYEQTRNDEERPWRKKNVNLKFSRMVTVFGTVLPLITLDAAHLLPGSRLWRLRPLERLALGLDKLDDNGLFNRWSSVLDAYEEFLSWKEAADIEEKLGALKLRIQSRADELSGFLYDALHHEDIRRDLKRFLVI